MDAGIDPGALTSSARWKSEPDIPWAAYAQVLEALDSARSADPIRESDAA